VKADIVNKDPLDKGLRVLLNAGHTVAHAIESDSNYKIPHGYAVATGLHMETVAGELLGYTKKGTSAKLAELLTLYGYELTYTPVSDKKFNNAITKDKKNEKDGVVIPFIYKLSEKMRVEKVEAGQELQ
jgi:3-dehydroquinate synthase